MLDTGGDVYEAAEECYGMVWWLAMELAAHQGYRMAERPAIAKVWIENAQEHYKDGLHIGGVQRES